MSVIYNALKKFKNHPQEKKAKKEDAQKERRRVSFKKLLFSSSVLTGCIFVSFSLGIVFLFGNPYQKQGVLAKTEETGIIVQKIQDRKAQPVKNGSTEGRGALKTSPQNSAGNTPAPSGSMDDSIIKQPSSDSSEKDHLNRARYLAPHSRNGPIQPEHLQNLDEEVAPFDQDILRKDQDTGQAMIRKPDKSGRSLAYKENGGLSHLSRHIETSSPAVTAEELGPADSDKTKTESAPSQPQSHPAVRQEMQPVCVRPSTEIVRLVAKIEKSFRHGTTVHTENLLDQLAALKGPDDRYVLKLRAYWSLQNNDYQSAASYLTQVLEKNSEDFEAGINMAIIDINSCRPQLARIRLQELEKIYPDNLLIADLIRKLH